MPTRPARLPYEAGNPDAEYIENETGDNAHTQNVPTATVVTVSDPVLIKHVPARTLTTESVPVDVIAVRVASDLGQRAALTLRAAGADIFIGGPGVTVGTGFLVPVGTVLTLETSAAVYAVAAGPATMYVLSQHRDG